MSDLDKRVTGAVVKVKLRDGRVCELTEPNGVDFARLNAILGFENMAAAMQYRVAYCITAMTEPNGERFPFQLPSKLIDLDLRLKTLYGVDFNRVSKAYGLLTEEDELTDESVGNLSETAGKE